MNDGGPAFPQTPIVSPNGTVETANGYFANCDGMTLRDYIAIHAKDSDVAPYVNKGHERPAARFMFADAMIAARAPNPATGEST